MNGVTVPGGEIAWRTGLPDEAASAALAGQFARVLKAPCAIYLYGDLGAGKTLFTRACVHALGFEGYVKSPSYGLLETYRVADLTVLHLDLYRIEDPEELEYLAIRDLYRGDTVLMVEWPDRGAGHLPAPDLALEFGESDEKRFVICHVFTKKGSDLASKIEV